MNYKWSHKELEKWVKTILIFLKNRKFISFNIEFCIIDSLEKNAYANRNNKIIITNSLLDYLNEYINSDRIDILNYNINIAKEVNLDGKYNIRLNKIKRKFSKGKVFNLWFKFIFLHELSHILRNHFNILKQTEIEEFFLKERRIDRFYFEIDADKFASAMLAPFISNENDINFFLESSGYLFHLLYTIENEEQYSLNDYPDPFVRLIFFYHNIYQFSQLYSNLKLNYNINEIWQNIEKMVFLNQQLYNKKIISDALEIKKYFQQYSEFIKRHKGILQSNVGDIIKNV